MDKMEIKLLKCLLFTSMRILDVAWDEIRIEKLGSYGLIAIGKESCVITPKGRRYLYAGAFERAVMEARRHGA